MHTSARTFGLTFAASLGLHGLLLLASAAFISLMPAWPREVSASGAVRTAPEPDEIALPEPQEVEITFLNITQIPEEKKPPERPPQPPVTRPSGDKMIYAREDRPALAPLNPDTPFISSQDMRAASTSVPTPGADPHLINQDGHDLPAHSLVSSAFAEGGESPTVPPPAPPVQANDTLADPQPERVIDPPSEQRPPEPQATVKTTDPLSPAPPDKPAEAMPPAPALRERPLEPVAEKKIPPRPVRPLDPVARRPIHSKPVQRASLSSLKTKSVGAVTQQGEASVDARDTPEGRYGKAVHDVLNPIWNRKLNAVRGLTGVGVVEVAFEIDIRGTVSNVRLVDPGKANPVFEDVCLTSIIKARLPPPPSEMQAEMRDPLSNGKLRRTISFYKPF